jgi:uncharacterized protein YecT (DUF1311 family)
MRLYFLTIVGILLLFMQATDPSHAEEAAPNCENPRNQIEINMCVKIRLDKAEREMNNLLDLKIQQLTNPSSERLISAQEAWIPFREKSCVYESGGSKGGSGWAMRYNSCMAIMAEKRTRELQIYLSCTANGCPD